MTPRPTRRCLSLFVSPGLRALRAALAATLLAFLPVALPGPAEARGPYPQKSDARPHAGVKKAKGKAIQGIDVSHWQQEIDWARVRGAGTRFAFIKATEGGDHLDPRFRTNWREAKEAGVPRGAYHFVFWCRPARDQIRWFIQNVPREPGALPPVLDVEWNNHSRCPRTSPEKARAKMREMLAAFERHYGQIPVIYTDINFHADVLEDTREFERYPFWVRSTAAYPAARYENRRWEFWQFTTTGRVPGVTGDVDRNAFFGSEAQFRAWMAGRYDIALRRPRGGLTVPSDLAAPAPRPPATRDPGRPQPPADLRTTGSLRAPAAGTTPERARVIARDNAPRIH
jgi:lysozyme